MLGIKSSQNKTQGGHKNPKCLYSDNREGEKKERNKKKASLNCGQFQTTKCIFGEVPKEEKREGERKIFEEIMAICPKFY